MQTHLARQRAAEFRREGEKRILKLSNGDLLIIGTTLYWAEGYKRVQVINGRARTHHPVALSNSDPRLVAIYLRFLREVCEVEDKNMQRLTNLFRFYKLNLMKLGKTNGKNLAITKNNKKIINLSISKLKEAWTRGFVEALE